MLFYFTAMFSYYCVKPVTGEEKNKLASKCWCMCSIHIVTLLLNTTLILVELSVTRAMNATLSNACVNV